MIKEQKIFLGNKRKEERINRESSEINKKVEIPEEKVIREISLIRPVSYKINVIEKNNEKIKENDINIQLNENKTTNLICPKFKDNHKQGCEKCGQRNNVLIFNSCQSILEYLDSTNFNNLLFKITVIFNKYIKLKYNKPKKICSDCLLKISNNLLELENFVRNNELNNEYPFNDLLENINLKNFNNNKTREKSPILNNSNKKILKEKKPIYSVINNLNNNFSNCFKNSHFIRPARIIPLNYKNISINEKEKENNINNTNNDKNDYIKIKNKDFDELFNLVSACYHKLLNIKNNRDLNLNLKDSNRKQEFSNFNLFSGVINKETYNNQINNKNFNGQLWNYSNKKY